MVFKEHFSRIFWVLVIFFAGVITVNGITTEVNLGDESHHFRFAQSIYQEGRRVPFDPLYKSGTPPGFFNNDPPLWHFGLAFLWKITGGISQTIAQVYHILFFVLLVWVTSELFKEIMVEKERWLPTLIIATVPMVVSFSTLFYMDIPVTALATISFYLIVKKRYLGAGIASGLMYFIKLNGGFFFPGFLFLIFWENRKRILDFLKNLIYFVIPVLLIHVPDLYWRKANITSKFNTVGVDSVVQRLLYGIKGGKWKEYLNSYLTNPEDIIKYFGLVFLFLFFFHLFRFRRWKRRDAMLWIPVASYLLSFMIVFGVDSDIRYLIPILPFLVVLSTQSVISFGKKWKILLFIICILQFVTTTYYVHQKRKISFEVKEVFEFVRKNVPKEALILYPEENLLIYGQRRMVWSAFIIYQSSKRFGLNVIFWAKDSEEMNEMLRLSDVDHILIKKTRIYDDRKEHHFGGYPQSFVERLPNLKGWVKIFENKEMALWKRVDGEN